MSMSQILSPINGLKQVDYHYATQGCKLLLVFYLPEETTILFNK